MIDATCSLTEAAEKMRSLNVGFLPVKEGTRLAGLLTDRDIVIRGLAEGLDPGSTQVKDILSSEVVYCYDDDSVEDAARLMEDNQIRRLIVVNHDQTPVGIVSIGDLPSNPDRKNWPARSWSGSASPPHPSVSAIATPHSGARKRVGGGGYLG
jgi:CBS domain-containing protein